MSRQYWEKRQLELLKKSVKEAEKDLTEIYRAAYDEIYNRLVDLYNKICVDNAPLISKLYQYNRYYSLMNNLLEITKALGFKEDQLLTQSLTSLYEKNQQILEVVFPMTSHVDKETINRLIHEDWVGDGNNFSDRIWKNKTQMAIRAKNIVMQCIANGDSPTKFIKELEPYMQKEGLWQAKRLLVTEMSHTQFIATIEKYKQAGVKTVEIQTAEDKKVCKECDDASSVSYPIDDCPILPLHANCRCTIISGD